MSKCNKTRVIKGDDRLPTRATAFTGGEGVLSKRPSALLMNFSSKLFMRNTSCSLSEGYMGCFDNECSSRAMGRGKMALNILANSIFKGHPSLTPPTL